MILQFLPPGTGRRCGNGSGARTPNGEYSPRQGSLSFARRTLAIAHAERSRSDACHDRRVKKACYSQHVTNHAAGNGRCRNHRLTERIQESNLGAAEHLIPIVFRELHELAALYIRREGPSHTLQPTALVHECYLRLVADQARALAEPLAFHWRGRFDYASSAD
jgi:ECF sigma factor